MYKQPNMEQNQNSDSSHAHPHMPLSTGSTSLPPVAIPRPFRLCEVGHEERATWCMQAAYELANLKNTAFYFGAAYDRVATMEETQLLLIKIIEMNENGRSKLAAILEAMVGLERTLWTVNIEEEVQQHLHVLLNFDRHCRARLTALNMMMEKAAELRATIAAQQAAMNGEGIAPEVLENLQPIPTVVEPIEQGEPTQEEVEKEGTREVEAEEVTIVVSEAPTDTSSSDRKHADNEKTDEVAQSEVPTKIQTPLSVPRLQFGSMTLAEAENYSTWRGTRSA